MFVLHTLHSISLNDNEVIELSYSSIRSHDILPPPHLLLLNEIKHDRVVVRQGHVPGKGRRHFSRGHLLAWAP